MMGIIFEELAEPDGKLPFCQLMEIISLKLFATTW